MDKNKNESYIEDAKRRDEWEKKQTERFRKKEKEREKIRNNIREQLEELQRKEEIERKRKKHITYIEKEFRESLAYSINHQKAIENTKNKRKETNNEIEQKYI